MIERLTSFFVLAKRFEGCHLTPYYCPAGVLTCGWGSTGLDVFPGRKWTQEYADMRLEQDGLKFAVGALAACPVLSITADEKLSAITDFAYNLGLGALRASTLRKRINAHRWATVPQELLKWVYAGGRKLRGLVIRRKAEAELFMKGDKADA